MSESDVADALRSSLRLVVVQAPAGCGKTFQGASYAADAARGSKERVLVLTHTHAARVAFHDKTKAISRVAIRTLDGLISNIASVYRETLGLPEDVASWARINGYDQVAHRVATLLTAAPTLCAGLVDRYPCIIFDEHQDASETQHAIALCLHRAGAAVRFFGDPLQMIYAKGDEFAAARARWRDLVRQSDACVALTTPHRWRTGCTRLGNWVMDAHARLNDGEALDLKGSLPGSVRVVRADNVESGYRYRPGPEVAREIRRVVRMNGSSMVLAPTNAIVSTLYGANGRSLPIWEGHTREELDRLVTQLDASNGDPGALCDLVVEFIQGIAVGFQKKHAELLRAEVTSASIRGGGAARQHARALATCLLEEPNHRGIGKMLSMLKDLSVNEPAFKSVHFRHPRELREALQLSQYETAEDCLAAASRVRAHSRVALPTRSIGTIHKSKGLEAENVVVVPLDAARLPADEQRRCLLYVGISRATSSLSLIVPHQSISQLVMI